VKPSTLKWDSTCTTPELKLKAGLEGGERERDASACVRRHQAFALAPVGWKADYRMEKPSGKPSGKPSVVKPGWVNLLHQPYLVDDRLGELGRGPGATTAAHDSRGHECQRGKRRDGGGDHPNLPSEE